MVRKSPRTPSNLPTDQYPSAVTSSENTNPNIDYNADGSRVNNPSGVVNPRVSDGYPDNYGRTDTRKTDAYGDRADKYAKHGHKSANPTDSAGVYTLTPEEARRYDGPDQQSFLVELRARFEGYVGDDPRTQTVESPGNITANTGTANVVRDRDSTAPADKATTNSGPLVVNSAGQVVASPKDKAPRVGAITYVRHPKGVAIAEYARSLAPPTKGPFNTGAVAPEQTFTSTIDPNTLPSRSRSVPNPQEVRDAQTGPLLDSRTNAQRAADEQASERLSARTSP